MRGGRWPGAVMGEEEEEEEEEGLAVPTVPTGSHSCSSVIRIKQERKRKARAKKQKHRRKAGLMPVKKESSDILDLSEYTKKQPWWRKLFCSPSGSHREKCNVVTQLTIGGGIGWCTGFIFQKVGKLAATAVGGGFFLLQIASQTGYIKIDWQLVEHDVSKAKEQLQYHRTSSSQLGPEVRTKVDEAVTFLKKNVILAGGFIGGFLLGMAS